MTKAEFISQVPYFINHPSWGQGELEIIYDNADQKGACYRHRDKSASLGSYGKTWDKVYVTILEGLVKLKQQNDSL